MKRRTLVALTLTLTLAPQLALAQAPAPAPSPSSDAARTEAADRFDRGLRLFNGGDTGGALAEFRRAYELIPNPLVLYNMGLVYAQMGRAVEAKDALDKVLASPGSLSADRAANAKTTRDALAARIAEVNVKVSVEGATIDVDGVEAGKAPLAQALRVTGGPHVIGATATGFAPLRKEITIAGGEKQDVSLELVAMQGKLAHLVVNTKLPAADVFVDGQRVGKTPLPASVSIAPGPHHVEVLRPGYTTAVTDIALGDGANGQVTLEPQEDPAAMQPIAGTLDVQVSEGQPMVTIDHRALGAYIAPIKLAPGPHHVMVEEGNFEPLERDVTISTGTTAVLQAQLYPTPEFHSRYKARATSQRLWGVISMVGGAVLAGGGIGLLVYDNGQRGPAQSTIDTINAESVRHSGLPCDPGGLNAMQCDLQKAAAQSTVDDANTRDYAAWAGVGVGAAALGLGIYLFATAHPDTYDRPVQSSQVTPTFWMGHEGGGGSLTWYW
jgi:hypothetical protein